MISKPSYPIQRAWFNRPISDFLNLSDDVVQAELFRNSSFSIQTSQRDAWIEEIRILRSALIGKMGHLFIEFIIPRMGRRVDAIIVINGILIVVEFKIGETDYHQSDIDQVTDYAIDLKYFHEGSHRLPIVPILVSSKGYDNETKLTMHSRVSDLYQTICVNEKQLRTSIEIITKQIQSISINPNDWESARYSPTPTIIEAAQALYANHGVSDITRNDAGAQNLGITSDKIIEIIEWSKLNNKKSICFVTGVPGSGKTLVGLNIATKHNNVESDLHSVFLSGNGPLVSILCEALSRDLVKRTKNEGKTIRKDDARTKVKAFIQNVHHFRDEYIRDMHRPPIDHIALFDEAQRAWDKERTASFMSRKKGVPDFNMSEPEFLISCMDRRLDWAVVICLVGGGQEINTGEAGIREWIQSIQRSFNHWHLFISQKLTDSEYNTDAFLNEYQHKNQLHFFNELHLSTSLRSFRSEKLSDFVKTVLDCEIHRAQSILSDLIDNYPIVITRNLETAKKWLRTQAAGTERFGIVVSSQAERLKPLAMDVRSPINPIKWFLDGKDDVRSSYYLEDVATEFDVQGLELDWACVSWDGDFRYNGNQGWQHYSFKGTKWQRVIKETRKIYLKNAYRVLLTRARQGMVIFIPKGSTDDPTRSPEYYDSTFEYLCAVGLPVI